MSVEHDSVPGYSGEETEAGRPEEHSRWTRMLQGLGYCAAAGAGAIAGITLSTPEPAGYGVSVEQVGEQFTYTITGQIPRLRGGGQPVVLLAGTFTCPAGASDTTVTIDTAYVSTPDATDAFNDALAMPCGSLAELPVNAPQLLAEAHAASGLLAAANG